MNTRPSSDTQITLFLDSTCLLCNKTVQWILMNEKDHIIHFCRLNSEFANKTIPEEYKTIDTVILLKNGDFYIYLDAFIQIIPNLKWYCKFLYMLVLLPPLIRKIIYKFIARNRKKWFGETQDCWLPTSQWKNRWVE